MIEPAVPDAVNSIFQTSSSAAGAKKIVTDPRALKILVTLLASPHASIRSLTLSSVVNVVTFVSTDLLQNLYNENILERAYFAVAMDRSKGTVLNEFVRLIVELSTRSPSDEQSEEALLLVLKLMADGAASAGLALQFALRKTNNQRLFCAAEGVSMLVQIILNNNNNNDHTIINNCLNEIRKLARFDHCRQAIVDSNVLPSLAQMLTNQNRLDYQTCILRLFLNLWKNDEFETTLCASGIVEAILSLISGGNGGGGTCDTSLIAYGAMVLSRVSSVVWLRGLLLSNHQALRVLISFLETTSSFSFSTSLILPLKSSSSYSSTSASASSSSSTTATTSSSPSSSTRSSLPTISLATIESMLDANHNNNLDNNNSHSNTEDEENSESTIVNELSSRIAALNTLAGMCLDADDARKVLWQLRIVPALNTFADSLPTTSGGDSQRTSSTTLTSTISTTSNSSSLSSPSSSSSTATASVPSVLSHSNSTMSLFSATSPTFSSESSNDVKALFAAAKKGLDSLQSIAKQFSTAEISSIPITGTSSISIFDVRDKFHQTLLHIIASNADSASVAWLLSLKNCTTAFVDRRDKNGFTALHAACSVAHAPCCELLLNAGASSTALTLANMLPLHYAVRSTPLIGSIVPRMINAGANVDARDERNETPLFHACLKGCVPAVQFLLSLDCAVNVINTVGESALHYAVRNASNQIVEMLLSYGANVDVRGSSGTPIEIAHAMNLNEIGSMLRVAQQQSTTTTTTTSSSSSTEPVSTIVSSQPLLHTTTINVKIESSTTTTVNTVVITDQSSSFSTVVPSDETTNPLPVPLSLPSLPLTATAERKQTMASALPLPPTPLIAEFAKTNPSNPSSLLTSSSSSNRTTPVLTSSPSLSSIPLPQTPASSLARTTTMQSNLRLPTVPLTTTTNATTTTTTTTTTSQASVISPRQQQQSSQYSPLPPNIQQPASNLAPPLSPSSSIRRKSVEHEWTLAHDGKLASALNNALHRSMSPIVVFEETNEPFAIKPRQTSPYMNEQIRYELLETELSYIEALSIVIDVFSEALQTIIPLDEYKMLFDGTYEILQLHRQFEKRLSVVVREWPKHKTLIGTLFVELAQTMKPYDAFVRNFEQVNNLHEKLIANNVAARNALASCKANPRVANRPLMSLLIQPIQRVPRYILLLSDLAKHTPSNSRDRSTLNQAVSAMRNVAENLNETKRAFENLARVNEVQARLVSSGSGNNASDDVISVLASGRSFVSEGQLSRLDQERSTRGARDYCLVLFNDALLLAKPAKRKLRAKQLLQLSELRVDPLTTPDCVPNAFVIETTTTTSATTANSTQRLLFVASSAGSRDQWVELIRATSKELKLTMFSREIRSKRSQRTGGESN